MSLIKGINLLLFTASIVSLIWARFCFFKINSKGSKFVSLVNDPTVIVTVILTYSHLFQADTLGLEALASLILYLLGVFFFWWTIKTAKQLDFANSTATGDLITNGPFSIVRHPFYFSYSLIWAGNLVLAHSILTVICFIVLISIYFYSAINEEKMILNSFQKREYSEYKKKVAMFVPFLGRLLS